MSVAIVEIRWSQDWSPSDVGVRGNEGLKLRFGENIVLVMTYSHPSFEILL